MIQQQLGDAAGLDRRSTRSHVAREQARAALLADASRGPVATDADDPGVTDADDFAALIVAGTARSWRDDGHPEEGRPVPRYS